MPSSSRLVPAVSPLGLLAPAVTIALLTGIAGAQALVRDINPSAVNASGSSSPGAGPTLNGVAIFPAEDGTHGRELWRSDGTAAGTYLLQDIRPGLSSSDPSDLVEIAGRVYFAADDGRNGEELWVTDGTPGGTVLFADLWPGPLGSSPRALAAVDASASGFAIAMLFFSADDGVRGREPWYLPLLPTPGSPTMVEVRPGASGSMTATAPMWVFGIFLSPQVMFPADDGVHGEEPWRLAPSSTPMAALAQDIYGGPRSSAPRLVQNANGVLLFSAFEGVHGRELFYAGTSAITLLTDLYPGIGSSNPGLAYAVGNPLLPEYVFPATSPVFGRELWRATTDGQGNWTVVLVKDIEPGAAGSDPELLSLTTPAYPLPVQILFAATTGANGRELWQTDATAAGTSLLGDIATGVANSDPVRLGVIPGSRKLVFAADNGIHGREPWISDGTPAGTFLAGVAPGPTGSFPSGVAIVGNTLLLSANDQLLGSELYQTDGSTNGVTLVADLRPPTTHSRPHELVAIDGSGLLLLNANDGIHGDELWVTDATASGTQLLVDIRAGSLGSNPSELFHHDGLVYFGADDGNAGRELWVSDGSAPGTRLVLDITPGANGSNPGQFVAFAGAVYFAATDATNGRELWRSDGTAGGTVRVADLVTGGGSSYPRGFAVMGANLYFTATDALGAELWKSDGTAAGTSLVKDIFAGANSSAPGTNPLADAHAPFVSGSLMYFAARGSLATGTELYRSDGTSAGTFLVRDIDAGAGDGMPGDFAAVAGRIVFAATTAASGREPWVTSGTTASTLQLLDVSTGAQSSDPSGFTLVGSNVVFAANRQGVSGFELWSTQGTSATTTLVKDIRPGRSDGVLPPDPGARVWFATVPSSTRAYFAAMDPATGVELWRTDGSSATTLRVADIGPGARGSFPSPPVRVGSQLVFAADDGVHGIELWSVDAPAAFLAFGRGCPGTGGVPSLSANVAPTLGSTTFRVALTSARPNAAAGLLVGLPARPFALGGGCVAYFDLFGPQITFTGATNGRGDGNFPFPVPVDRALSGLRLTAQSVVVDPAGALFGALAVSSALEILLGS